MSQEEGTVFTEAGAGRQHAFEELKDDQGGWEPESRTNEEGRNLRKGTQGDEA